MVSVENFHRSARAPSAARGHAGRITRRYDIAGQPSIHDFAVSLYRAPISKYAEMLAAVTGLFFFSNYYDPYE
jgi:hypothetical protein